MSSGEKNEEEKNTSKMSDIEEKKEEKNSQNSSSGVRAKEDLELESNRTDENETHTSEEGEESGDEEEEEEEDEFEEELIEAFNDLDKDHSGTITKEEFGDFMRKLGYRPTLVELQEMMEEAAKDHPGQITFEEFKHILTKSVKDEFTLNSTVEAFSVFDKNNTGKLKKDMLKNILLTRGEQNMTEAEVQDLLDHYIDFDENGEIDYKKFVKQTFELFK